MEALIFYLVLLAPLSIHCAVTPASVEEDLRNQEEIHEFGKLQMGSTRKLNIKLNNVIPKYLGIFVGCLYW